MWEKLGYPVLKLKRVGFAGLSLGRLQPGESRALRPAEVQRLKKMTAANAPGIMAAGHPVKESQEDEEGNPMKFSKKGDRGFTSLLGGQRIPKSGPRPEAYGTLDEASSALGIARASATRPKTKEILISIQKDLIVLGAELATAPEDFEKYPHQIKPIMWTDWSA